MKTSNHSQMQIIDEAHKNFTETVERIIEGYKCGDTIGIQPHIEKMFSDSEQLIPLTKEEFITKCKTDKEFSKRWGFMKQRRQ